MRDSVPQIWSMMSQEQIAGMEKRKKNGMAAAANEAEIRGPSLKPSGNLQR